jgi:copper chaperone CopZ
VEVAMFRRQFVQFFAGLGVTGVATLAMEETNGTSDVTYVVKGFSCVTCAVGLDTMLQKQKGISWCKSTYPQGIAKVRFDAKKVQEKEIQDFIREMGFTVAEKKA